MPVLLVLLLAGVVIWIALDRRGSSLTRACRWRLDRDVGAGFYRCASCGATCTLAPGRTPRACLATGRGA